MGVDRIDAATRVREMVDERPLVVSGGVRSSPKSEEKGRRREEVPVERGVGEMKEGL